MTGENPQKRPFSIQRHAEHPETTNNAPKSDSLHLEKVYLGIKQAK